MKYTVVSAEHIQTLVSKVNDAIEVGWEPIGGVARGEGIYLQALYKNYTPTIFDVLFTKPKHPKVADQKERYAFN